VAATPKGQKPKLPDVPIEIRRVTSDATIEKLASLIATSPGLQRLAAGLMVPSSLEHEAILGGFALAGGAGGDDRDAAR